MNGKDEFRFLQNCNYTKYKKLNTLLADFLPCWHFVLKILLRPQQIWCYNLHLLQCFLLWQVLHKLWAGLKNNIVGWKLYTCCCLFRSSKITISCFHRMFSSYVFDYFLIKFDFQHKFFKRMMFNQTIKF